VEGLVPETRSGKLLPFYNGSQVDTLHRAGIKSACYYVLQVPSERLEQCHFVIALRVISSIHNKHHLKCRNITVR
jgi:hypothetical protein